MRTHRVFAIVFIFLLSLGAAADANASAAEARTTFPVYGTGPVEVRLYADYFCDACAAIEPELEPIMKDLVKKNLIKLTLVDVPFSSNTRLYATYFLYALNAENTIDQAFYVKDVLFKATTGPNRVIEEDAMKKLFKCNGIAYTPFTIKPALNRYNALMREDKIDSSPTCVIIRGGKKEKIEDGKKIIEALKKIK
jgi:protein-disulfide isomerase